MVFEGKKKGIQIRRGTSFDTLKKKISRKLNLEANQIVSRLTCRFVVSDDNKFTGIEIADDDDVDLMINAFEQQSYMNVIELYVEIDTAGGSLFPARSWDMNVGPLEDDVAEVNSPIPYTGLEYQAVNTHGDGDDDDDDDDDVDYYEDENMSDEDADEEDDVVHEDIFSHEEVQDVVVGTLFPTSVHVASPIAYVGDNMEQAKNVQGQPPTHIPYWHGILSYINWDHPDQENDVNDNETSWEIGDELYVRQEFGSKEDVKMAIKQYSMKVYQNYYVVESNKTKLFMKCPKHEEGC